MNGGHADRRDRYEMDDDEAGEGKALLWRRAFDTIPMERREE